MAAPIYDTDLQDISTADSVTNWDESSDSGWDDGGAPSLEQDYYIQGTACISETLKTGIGSLIYSYGTNITIPTNGAVITWHYNQAPNALGTLAEGGIRQIVGNSYGDFYAWSVLGSDTYEYGGWKCIPVDPTLSVDYTVGAPTGNWSYFGNAHNQTGNVFKGNPHGIDAQRWGRCISYYTEGELANPANFAGYAAVNDSTTNRWGLFQSIEGGYLFQGLMSMGSGTTTAVYFDDSNVSININDTIKVSRYFNKIEIHHPSTYVSWDTISFNSIGNISKGSFEMVDNCDVNIASCTFTNMDIFIFDTGATITDTTFRRCGTIYQSGATFDGCLFADSTGSTSLLVDDLDLISNCDFISDGSNHAMELDSNNAGGSFVLVGCTYTDYATVSGSTGNEAIYNNSGGHVILSISGGDTPTIRNGSGASTEFVSSAIFTLTVQDSNQLPIDAAYTYLMDSLGNTIDSGITNGSGQDTLTYLGADTSGTIRVRKYGYEPYSLNVSFSSNASLNIAMVSDPVQTASPPDLSSEWLIDYTGKTVTNLDSGTGNNLPISTGGTWFVNTTNSLFRWLANDFSTLNNMQYSYPINALTPTVYEWVNGWKFGDFNNDYKYLNGGSIEATGSTHLWSNIYSIGTQTDGTRLYIIQNDEEISPWWITGNIDILLPVRQDSNWILSADSDGLFISGGSWVYAREFGDLYDHNFIDLSAGGRNPISINTSQDINNTSGEIYLSVANATGFVVDNFVLGGTSGAIGKIEKISTNDIYLNSVRGGTFTTETITEYSDRELQNPTGQSTTVSSVNQVMSNFDNITITFSGVTKDLLNGSGPRPYEVVINCSGETVKNMYEYLKYVVRYSSSGTSYTIQNDAGQEYRNASGTTWNDVKVAPFGTFAGGKFFGARGVWIENMSGADVTNYQLIDSNNQTQSPPVQYSFELTGLKVNSEVRVYSGASYDQEIAGVENSSTVFTYVYTYDTDISVKVVIHNIDYVYVSFYTTLSNSNSSIPIQQQTDRWFNNPI